MRNTGWLLISLLYLALATHVASLWPKTSDQASYFLAGLDVLHGNPRLKGWTLTPPDFYTSDIALTALLSGLWRALGHPAESPFLLMLQPALLWTGLIISAFAVVLPRVPKGPDRTCATMLLLPILAVPLMRSPMAYFITLSAIHVGTLIYGLWAIHHASRFLSSGSVRSLLATALLLCLGIIGDPLLTITGTGALVLYALIGAETPSLYRAILSITAILATVLAKLFLHINATTGGFQTETLDAHFTTWDQIASNFGTSFRAILFVFGAEPSGLALSAALPECLRLGLVVLALSAAFRVLRRALKHKLSSEPFRVILVLSALLNFLALALSNRIALDGSPIAVARYLFPLWITLGCVTALVWCEKKRIFALATAILAVTLLANARSLPRHSTGLLSAEDNELLNTLQNTLPENGVGSWWSSSNLEVASLGRVHIIPGMKQPDGTIAPFIHIRANTDWTSLRQKPFFVLIPHPEETFSEAEALKTFGAPVSRLRQGRYTLLLYSAAHIPPHSP